PRVRSPEQSEDPCGVGSRKGFLPHGAVSGVGEWHEVPRGRGPQDRKGSTVVSRPASLAPPALEVLLVGATAPYLPPHYVRRQGPSPFAYGSGRQTAAQPAAGGLIPFAYGSGRQTAAQPAAGGLIP